ncbi:MAG TPA: hypothetical protein VK828_13270 [Terriglobales bacterium]|jgi:hypothetical protein|nr:hypothetical protein [Terriglobales bacterium]
MSGREHGHDPLLPHGAQAVAPAPSATHEPPSHDLPSDDLEVVPGFERENLQGWIPQLATEADIRAVIEKAFDYRGDVSITRKNMSEITGYLFDRRIGPTLETSVVRLMLATSNDRPAVPYSEIAAIAFTGRDTAAGKSYEAWVKKYWEKRAKGEKNISIEPEALE